MQKDLRFEARDLKLFAQPVDSGTLRRGEVYFAVNFFDDAMRVPTLKPVVFAGKDLEPGDVGQVYFQDIDSYNCGVQYDAALSDSTAVFERGDANSLGHIFEFEHALEELMRCSLRRKRHDSSGKQ